MILLFLLLLPFMRLSDMTSVVRLSLRRWLLCCLVWLGGLNAIAQTGQLEAVRQAVPDGYDFWVYTPPEYGQGEPLPLILFLHGASLCGRNLDRVLRYGPIHAVRKGMRIPAVIMSPQNTGGQWNTEKLDAILEYTKDRYDVDPMRVYVIGMSLGGYGTLDFVALYPEKVAAAMALCGGTTLKDFDGLEDVPLWIIHGTGDRAVSVRESQKVTDRLQDAHLNRRLRYDWLSGVSHGALARLFYLDKTYDWLFSHTLCDKDRKVNRDIRIDASDLTGAYYQFQGGEK